MRARAWCAGRRDYFCAGVMSVNLRTMREEEITEQVFAFLDKYRDAKFADQTALNTILAGRVKLLDQRWQTQTLLLPSGRLSTPVVLHYANEVPWRRTSRWSLLSDIVVLWHAFNDICVSRGGRTSLRRHYSPMEIVFKRGLYLALQHTWLKRLLYGAFRMLNRPGIVPQVDPYVRALGRDCLAHYRRQWREMAAGAGWKTA